MPHPPESPGLSPTPQQTADLLLAARLGLRTLEPLTALHGDLDETWAYDVQALDRAARTSTGDPVVGAKLGLTSAAKQQRMGVARPIAGFLTASMRVEAAEVGSALTRWTQPRIEPEIAFVTAHAIDRALAADELGASVEAVVMAAEIIDSRWTDYRFGLPDVVADNTSAAGYVVGTERRDLGSIGDLASLRCEVTVDGEVVHRATGAAILGNPLLALQWLSAHLGRRQESLPAGSLVLAGALTDAVPLVLASSYHLSIEGLGSVSVAPTTPAT